jgi:hypothetical protein
MIDVDHPSRDNRGTDNPRTGPRNQRRGNGRRDQRMLKGIGIDPQARGSRAAAGNGAGQNRQRIDGSYGRA